MDRIGVFRVKESFNISGRGIVVVGYFLEGRPKLGSILTLIIDNKTAVAKITGVETGNIDDEGNFPFGLLLLFENASFRKFLEKSKIQEQIVNIDFEVKTGPIRP